MKQKIYKVLSIMLTLAVILSTCLCAVGTVSAAGAEAIYYVSPNGLDTNDGKTADTAFGTLNAAITAANDAGYTTGDTVYLKVVHVANNPVLFGESTGTMANHDYLLNVSSLSDRATIGKDGLGFKIQGDVEFENVIINANGTQTVDESTGNTKNNYSSLDLNGQNVTFGKDTLFSGWIWNSFLSRKSATYNDDINLVFENGLQQNSGSSTNKTLILGADWGRPVYNGDINLTFDSSAKSYSVKIGSNNADNKAVDPHPHSAVFNGNVNFNIKAATGLTLSMSGSSLYKTAFGENAAVQIINSSGLDTADWKTLLSTASDNNKIIPPKYFIINNATGNKEAIAFTDTAGKYKVNLDVDFYENIALVNTADPSIKVETDNDGYVTVTEKGEYTLQATRKDNVSVTYYVSETGDDANNGKTAPVKTVAKAVGLAIANGCAVGDTVNIKATGTIEWGTLDSYSFTLNVATDEAAESKASLNLGTINGDLVLDNINITNDKTINLHGNDLTLGAGASMPSVLANLDLTNQNQVVNETQTVIINNKFKASIVIGNNSMNGSTWNKDLNIIVNNANAAPTISFSTYWGGTKTIEGDLNFIFNKVNSVSFGTPNGLSSQNRQYKTIVKGAFNVFVPALANVAGKSNIVNWATENNYNYYFITDAVGIYGAVELTDTVGKYKVDKSVTAFDIVAYDANRTQIKTDADGYFTFAKGEYEIALYKDPEIATYYVSGSGSDDAEGTKDAPLKSVVGAIVEAISDNMIKGDTVNVVVLDDTTWASSTVEAPSAHTFDLIVSSKDAQTIAGVTVTNAIGFLGDTTLENIKFSGFGQYNVSPFNDHNIIIGANTTFKPYGIAFGKGNGSYTAEGQTIVFNNAINLNSNITIGNANNGNKVYTEDINIVLNNRNAAPRFAVTMKYGMSITYKKNINLNVKDADSVAFVYGSDAQYPGKVVAEGAMQFIIDKPYTTINDATKSYLDSVNFAKGIYYIYNTSGIDGLLSFTETAGKYAVDTETYIVKATKDGVDTIAKDGFLTLSEGGEYTVTAELRPATTLEYFVQIGSDAENTFDTIAEAVEAAKAVGLTKIDTLNIKVTGTNVAVGELPEYSFTVIVESKNEKATLNTEGYFIANGKTIYRNIDLSGENLDLNGKAVTLENTVGFNGLTIDASDAKAIINAKLALVEIIGENNLDVVVNNPESEFTVALDVVEFNNIKINVKSAKSVAFTGTPVVKGKVEIAVPNSSTIDGKSVIDAIDVENKWYIVNKTDVADAIDFTSVAGTYDYASGYQVAMVGGGKTYEPINVKLTVPAGEYEVVFKAQPEAKYSDYIKNRGTGLKNIYSKLKAGEQVNVLYMGGSVTNGTGASNAENTTWRAKVGKWIENAFSAANVNNVNVAYGGTGTWFGVYRLKEEVLSKAPDLIFIEFSINDFYDHATKDEAAMRFETLVRQIRVVYPECDIVTLFTTEKSHINGNHQGSIHTQAQAHEGMAIAYDVPSIHIGRALADHLYLEAGSDWENIWADYMTDIVHPTDKGYAVYYEVIKEYLANELVYGQYDGTVTEHTVPELQYDKLHDGDITFIDANEELISKSESLGGNGFTYVADNHFRGSFTDAAKTTSGKFVIKFIGTELAVFSGSAKGVIIKVDGGNETTCNLTGTYPDVVATGLEFGEHTVEITASVELKIYGFFTRNETKATHNHKYGAYTPNNDATCQKNGTETAVCSICGGEDTREIANSIVVCKFTNYVVKDAAECGKNATEIAVCDYGCGETDERVVDGSALEHNYQWIIDKKNNCGVKGAKHEECSLCHEKRNENTAIAATGKHTYSNNCDTSCNVCKATRTITHTYKTTTTKATTSKNGKIVKACSVCKKVYSTKTIYYAKKVKLSTAEYTYNGKAKKPSVKVYDYKGNKISSSYYTVSYASGRKNVGKYKVTIKLKGNYSGTLTAYFTIVPKESKVEKLTAAKKSLKVKIKKVSSQASGYEIQYSTSSKFKSAKTKKVTSYKTTSVTLKSLKAKKTYYVRVRTYKTVDGKKYYSDWSSKKSKKTK